MYVRFRLFPEQHVFVASSFRTASCKGRGMTFCFLLCLRRGAARAALLGRCCSAWINRIQLVSFDKGKTHKRTDKQEETQHTPRHFDFGEELTRKQSRGMTHIWSAYVSHMFNAWTFFEVLRMFDVLWFDKKRIFEVVRVVHPCPSSVAPWSLLASSVYLLLLNSPCLIEVACLSSCITCLLVASKFSLSH